jgi:hypothetical protein
MFGLQHKKKVVGVLDFFLSFLKKYDEKKSHNMLSLMLNPRLKTCHLVCSLVGCEQGKAIVAKYDTLKKIPMLLKRHYHLHPLPKSERGVVDQRIEKDSNLDIFEIIVGTSEPTTKLINRKLLIFRCYQVYVKNMKCPLQWWEKHENMRTCFLQLASMLDKS